MLTREDVTEPLGITVNVQTDAFSVRVSSIVPGSPATQHPDLDPGSALLDIFGEFVMDCTQEEVEKVIAQDGQEVLITYVAAKDINRAVLNPEESPVRPVYKEQPGDLPGSPEAIKLVLDQLEADADAETAEGPTFTPGEPTPPGSPTFSAHAGAMPGTYSWQSTDDTPGAVEARRQELLSDDGLTTDPDKMEEWLALLMARNNEVEAATEERSSFSSEPEVEPELAPDAGAESPKSPTARASGKLKSELKSWMSNVGTKLASVSAMTKSSLMENSLFQRRK